MSDLEKLNFLTKTQVRNIGENFGTPTFIYSQKMLERQADKALSFQNAYGLTVRYAMKASPNVNILRIFYNKGIHIDASSGDEANRAMMAQIPGQNILLTSQQIPDDLPTLLTEGVQYNACSKLQLTHYGLIKPNSDVSVRINPGRGSGGNNRTSTGGETASFGIWHEQIGEVLDIAKKYKLNIKRIHTHIGSGSDPNVWKEVAGTSLGIVKQFLDAGHNVDTLNLGGGYKVGRMSYENSVNMQEIGGPVRNAFIDFKKNTKTRLKLEIEPGTFLVANAGSIVSQVVDIKQTTENYKFLIIDSGMTENTRINLYGAQHPLIIVPRDRVTNESRGLESVIVSGHCCESGDVITVANENSEELSPRLLTKAKIGDFIVMEGAGAYCAGMSAKNYNSFPEAAEVLQRNDGELHEIRGRQSLENITYLEQVVI